MKNKFFRWLSIWLSAPCSCCRSSELPGGEIMGAKIIAKKPWDFGSFILWVILHRIGEKSSIWLFVPRLICTLIRKSTLFFSGWQNTWDFLGHGTHFFLIYLMVATPENLRCFCYPEKNRVDFTGRLFYKFGQSWISGLLGVETNETWKSSWRSSSTQQRCNHGIHCKCLQTNDRWTNFYKCYFYTKISVFLKTYVCCFRGPLVFFFLILLNNSVVFTPSHLWF